MLNHKILKIAASSEELRSKISKELGISEILAQILINRNISSLNEAKEFLNINTKHMHDPNLFSDMHKAVAVIKKALKDKEKIMVFGDYDVDGITALALVKDTLSKKGADVLHYLPHRINEGYGLTKNILHTAKSNKVKLLITVDCGTSNHKEIEELRRSGIEVIVTDHHEPSMQELPHASAIINPKTKNSGYKFRELAGVGVAYKLCQAISGSLLLDELDLVSLGTIADSVPLTGENRIIAKEGLARLPKTKRSGIKMLIENAGIQDKKFTSTFVSFIIAPRLNASGRMDTAETSLKLLMSRTKDEAKGLAEIIEIHNRQRQKVEEKILQEAEAIINKEVNFKEHKVIVIAKEDWHKGVLGIVASKIADKFYRPAIVISIDDETCKGSARSIKNFHLFDALKDCKEFLDSFGGHAHAAGLLISKNSIDDFKRSINLLANKKLSIGDLIPSVDIDMEVELSNLNEEIIRELELLEPFGNSNPEPLFMARNLKMKGQAQELGRQTLKFWVTDGQATFQAIGFGMSGLKDSIAASNNFDLVFFPRIDTWRQDTSVILEIRDIFLK